jgi:hypothetical protein
MFKTPMGNNALYNDATNNFFNNITGASYRGDISFVSTLRALVFPRMAHGEHISVQFGRSTHSAEHIGTTESNRMVKTICEYMPSENGSIYIHSFARTTQEDNFACLELIKSSFNKTYSGWKRLDKVTDFFRKQFYVVCFVHPEQHRVALFVDRLDLRILHYLQCAIFAFLPWYFDPKAGVSEIEMELIESLREKTEEKYIDCLNRIAEKYDFRTENIKRLLKGFEINFEKAEKESLTASIADIQRQISDLNRRIGQCLKSKNEKEISLLGIETRMASATEDSEIMDYFLCNKKLSLDYVEDTSMTFVVKDYYTYFDESMAKSMIENGSSYIYSGYEGLDIRPEAMKKLMLAVFVDQTLRIKCCAAYCFNLYGEVEGISHYNFRNFDCSEYMPNIHIDEYRCLGNYNTTINTLLSERNYIGAIEQCVASCKSLNFADSTVMREFMNVMYGESRYNNKCIELPDGKVVTPKEAISWLEEKEAEKTEAKEEK